MEEGGGGGEVYYWNNQQSPSLPKEQRLCSSTDSHPTKIPTNYSQRNKTKL